MEFGFVWWLDISVHLLTAHLDAAMNYAISNSFLVFVSRSPVNKISVAKQTAVQTFRYLGEDTCKYRHYGEVDASTVLFHYDNNTHSVVKAWATCALNKRCIAPVGKEKLHCDFSDDNDGRCHRFDQSVLGILFRRLHHEQNLYPTNQNLSHIYFVGRREFFHYFERCRNTYTCY